METVILCESAALDSSFTLDEANCVVKGVKAMGAISRNGWVFPREMRQKAYSVLEGAQVNWDHIPKGATEVPLATRFGWLTNFREDPTSDCTRADLHYLKEHQHVGNFLSMVRQNPKLCSLSIRGDATAGHKDPEGRKVISQILTVHSFDLVSEGANVVGLREAAAAPPTEPAPGVEEPAKTDDYGAEGCLKAIGEIVAGAGDARKKLEAIKAHLEQLEETEGGGESEEDEETPATVEESAKIKTRADCVKLCESHKVAATEALLNILVHVPADKRESIVKRKSLVTVPQSGAPSVPLRESVTTPTETDQQRLDRIAARLRGV